MSACFVCNEEAIVSESLPVCVDCIRDRFVDAKRFIEKSHGASREEFGLVEYPPRTGDVKCPVCVNECVIPEKQKGYCGLRKNEGGKLVQIGGTKQKGILDYYFDNLPTNCVADFVCPGSKMLGKKNLSVFYRSCNFNCMFCQNWHYKNRASNYENETDFVSAEELAGKVDSRTFCVCFFGGDPAVQMEHALETANKLKGKVKICWETNGSMNESLVHKMAEISLRSGGCIKFDLKAFSENLAIALTGSSNRLTLENFKRVAQYKRLDFPLLIASTPLIPGYIDEEEIYQIASFIAAIDIEIPYSLLAFHPDSGFSDLPFTSTVQAKRSAQIAQDCGLKKVFIGNIHILDAIR